MERSHVLPAPTPPGRKLVLLARPRGFCAGVERAVRAVEEALELHGPPVYVRRQIVRNKHVVARSKLVWLSQTTLAVDETRRIVKRLRTGSRTAPALKSTAEIKPSPTGRRSHR